MIIIAGLLMVMLSQNIHAQTANLEKGCVPLTVQFDAPFLSNYYWDFKDGTTSDFKNPEHIFTTAGIYNVDLRNGENGSIIGSIEVEVFPDPTLSISLDSFDGCLPLTVSFKPIVNIHSDIEIESYLWTFGDGNDSTLENPVYTYTKEGAYDVSLKIFTSFEECNKVVIKERIVNVLGIVPEFTSNTFTSCSSPATFDFDIETKYNSLHTYHWNFGQGDSIDIYDPEPIVYNNEGTFPVSLTITTETGCQVTTTKNVRVGAPLIDIHVPEPICTNSIFKIENLIPADKYEWDITPETNATIFNPSSRETNFKIDEPGNYEISYVASTFDGCETDTSFVIEVGYADASLSGLPEISCGSDFEIILTADNLNYTEYTWSGYGIEGDTVTPTPSLSVDYVAPERDSFYLNAPDSLRFFLMINSESGCVDQKSYAFPIVKPDAYFIPDSIIGWCPLSMGFEDVSYSANEVMSRIWDFGDGTTRTLGKEDTMVVHTYTAPGEYNVRLTLVDENGCADQSELVEIQVVKLESGTGSGSEFDPSDPGNCNIEFGPDEILCTNVEYDISLRGAATSFFDIHLDTDDSRMNHCWLDRDFPYTFLYPGEYPVSLDFEYEGLFVTTRNFQPITIHGAHAEAEYRIDCDNPYEVEFWSESIEATKLAWIYKGDTISREDKFKHRFNSTGDFKVYLQATNSDTECKPHLDSVMVHVREIHAEFELEDILCANSSYILDASLSMDVDTHCNAGFRWEFEEQRPRTTSNPQVQHRFVAGHQIVKLTIEDINGCKDTATKSIDVYGMEPDIQVPSLICLPHETQLLDLTESDTTIVEWGWSIGSTEQNPHHTFTTDDTVGVDKILVKLYVTDAAGCEESTSKLIDVYEPETWIELDGNQIICKGTELQFSAGDVSQVGLPLDLDWDFGPFDASLTEDSTQNVSFEEAGDFMIQLNYQEVETGCAGSDSINIQVVELPVANFSSSHDAYETICYPETLQFTNESFTDGPTIYRWDFDNGLVTNLKDPSTSFNKGDFEVSLRTSSIYGCSDTQTRTYRFIGPEGNLAAIDDVVCLYEDFTLEVTDLVDVTNITWDFGDGTLIQNVNPVTHNYTFRPPGDETMVQLILQSDDTGCEFIETQPINLSAVYADFELTDRTGYCAGELNFNNLSQEATDYLWTFNGNQSTVTNPILEYDQNGPQEVTLDVFNSQTGCEGSLTKTVDLVGHGQDFQMPNVFTPDGDGVNDYFTVVAQDEYQDLMEVKEFKIYNRWGNLIYDNESPDGWDGTFQGQLTPNEVYAYYVEFMFERCGLVKKKGSVTVID